MCHLCPPAAAAGNKAARAAARVRATQDGASELLR
jgi:hypothetical protein